MKSGQIGCEVVIKADTVRAKVAAGPRSRPNGKTPLRQRRSRVFAWKLEIGCPNYGAVMIDHTGLQVSDPVVSREFYDKALAPLGYKMMVQIPKEHTGGLAVFGYGVPPKADFWVGEGTPNAPRVHVAFRAETHNQVNEFYRAALAAGGKDNGSPGPRPHYHKDYYGAFVLDPDGHNVEAVCHAPK